MLYEEIKVNYISIFAKNYSLSITLYSLIYVEEN